MMNMPLKIILSKWLNDEDLYSKLTFKSPIQKTSDRGRIYGEFYSGKYMEMMDTILCSDGTSKIIVIAPCSDKTPVSSEITSYILLMLFLLGTTGVWPLSVTLLNWPYSVQTTNKARELFAYLPILKKNEVENKQVGPFCNTLLFHSCWDILCSDSVFDPLGN
jgi:hypothetical protein